MLRTSTPPALALKMKKLADFRLLGLDPFSQIEQEEDQGQRAAKRRR